MRGTGILTFWTEGYRTYTFQDEKVKNLLSSAFNRGDLRRLNYNRIVFGRGSAQDPAGRAHAPGWGGIPPPHFLPLVLGPNGVSFSF